MNLELVDRLVVESLAKRAELKAEAERIWHEKASDPACEAAYKAFFNEFCPRVPYEDIDDEIAFKRGYWAGKESTK